MSLLNIMSKVEKEVFSSEFDEAVCINLLKAMETEEFNADQNEESMVVEEPEDELSCLPKE